jgi:hypothetical protein
MSGWPFVLVERDMIGPGRELVVAARRPASMRALLANWSVR